MVDPKIDRRNFLSWRARWASPFNQRGRSASKCVVCSSEVATVLKRGLRQLVDSPRVKRIEELLPLLFSNPSKLGGSEPESGPGIEIEDSERS